MQTDDRVLNTAALILSRGATSLYKGENIFVEHEDNTTPMQILHKKNFTKLPVWDFEDVYLQDPDARKPVSCCPVLFRHHSGVYISFFKSDPSIDLFKVATKHR